MNEPTQKQIDLVECMMEFINDKPKDFTKKAYSDFISKNIELYKLYSTDNHIITNGYF